MTLKLTCLCFACIVFAGLRALGAAPAGETEALVAGWLAKQTNIQQWAAEFRQTRTLKGLAQPLVSTGQVWFAAPNNFRWELGKDQTIAIRNGEVMLVVYPRLKRAERYNFEMAGKSEWKDAISLLQSGFPRSRRELDQQFRIVSAIAANDVTELQLEPRSAGARKMMPRINLFLTPELTLSGTELVFADGSKMRNDFRSPDTNAATGGKFELKIPEGFKVVEPLRERAR